MEFANINDTMRTAKEQDKRFVPLFGADNFRSWILYFRPGEHTDMHYHMSPETFLVLQGKASVKGLTGEERIIEKNEIVFFWHQRLLPDHRCRNGALGACGQSL
jgi:quercetin dioxygenase-like cupin family protein